MAEHLVVAVAGFPLLAVLGMIFEEAWREGKRTRLRGHADYEKNLDLFHEFLARDS